MKKNLFMIVAVGMCLIGGSPHVYSIQYVNITLESNASIDGNANRLYDDGKAFILDTESDGVQPWLSFSVSYEGNRSMGFRALSDTDSLKERSEIVVRKDDDLGALKFGQTRYMGYAIYPHTQASEDFDSVIISQASQRGHGDRPVPFLIYYESVNGDVQFWVRTADSDGNIWNSPKYDLPVGVWSTIQFRLTMRHKDWVNNQEGRIEVWLNESRIILRDQFIGYVPGSSSGGGIAENNWKVACGIYSPRTEDADRVIMLDNIRWSGTLAESLP